MVDKERISTHARLKQYEDELQNPKVVKRKEVAQKVKEAREQSDLSENAGHDAARDEQRGIKLCIGELEGLPKNTEIVIEDEVDLDKINIGCKVKLLDVEYNEEMEFYTVDSIEINSLQNKINNESSVNRALMGKVVGECVDVETQTEGIQYKVLEIQRIS